MPVALYTYHGKATWMPDHPRGCTRKRCILPTDPHMAKKYRERQRQPLTEFDSEHQQVLLSGVFDVCRQRGWRLHCFASEPSHVHVLVSWKGEASLEAVSDRVKNLLSLFLGQHAGEKGREWFSRKASRKRVRDSDHFAYLMDSYLPKHGGLLWKEGNPPPPEIEKLLRD